MEVPRNQTMNAAFFAAIGAAMIYYLVARVSMKMVVNKSDGVSSSAELMLAWMFVLTYIVAVGAIGVLRSQMRFDACITKLCWSLSLSLFFHRF